MVKGLEDIHEPSEAELADVEVEDADVLVPTDEIEVEWDEDAYRDEEYDQY